MEVLLCVFINGDYTHLFGLGRDHDKVKHIVIILFGLKL